MGAERQRVDTHSRCIEQRIANGRGRCDHRGFTKGLVAITGGGLKGFDKIMVQRRDVHKGRKLIIEKIVVIYMAGLPIDQHLFEQRCADPHKSSAMNLAGGLNRIKDDPGIMDIDNLVDLDLAQGNIDIDINKGAAEHRRITRCFIRYFSAQLPAPLLMVIAVDGQVLQTP